MSGVAYSSGGPLLDGQRSGSAWKQVLVGILGVVLAIVLVAGQIMVATTAGIAENMRAVNANLEAGNEVMFEIIEKAAPTPALEKAVRRQNGTLSHTRDTLVLLNAELDKILASTDRIAASSVRLDATVGSAADTVDSMAANAAELDATLAPLPGATNATNDALGSIAADSAATDGELTAVGETLEGYGLPQAEGAPR